MEKVKVLHLIASPVLGGAERVVLTLAKGLEKDKFNLLLGVFIDQRVESNPFWQEAEKFGLPVHPIPFRTPYDMKQLFELHKLFSTFRPHIVHTHGYKSNWLGIVMAKRFGIPIISTLHGWFHQNNIKTRIIAKIDQCLFKWFDLVIPVSDKLRLFLAERGVAEKKMVTIRNVPPVRKEQGGGNSYQIRKELQIPESSKIVGFVGRLEPVKGCALFLEAASIVCKSEPGVSFIVVGEGSERDALEAQVRKVGLNDRVYFCGFREDLMNIYASLDLYVLSSYNEGIPLTLLEAMAHRVPVVATAVGGVTEIIKDPINGVIVQPGDPQALADKIKESLADEQETQTRVDQAFNTIKADYNVDRWVQKFQDLYEKVVFSCNGRFSNRGERKDFSRDLTYSL